MTAKAIGSYRWIICGLLFLATMVNYIDRQIVAILKPDLSVKLGWTEDGYANIVEAFQLAYAFGYLFGGRFMDLIGVRRGFPIAATIWSIACAAHGLARSVTGFSVARLGLGIAEGGNFPAAVRTVGEWFPVRERAYATGIFNSASNVGAIVCPLIVPPLADAFGWPAAFYATGGLGILWVFLWLAIYQPPEKARQLTASELAYIEEGRAVQEEPPPTPLREIVGSRPALAYAIASALTGPVWWFYLFWLPDFLNKQFHMNKHDAGYCISVVYTISILGSVGGGWLPMQLIRRSWSRNAARKFAMLVCACCVVPVGLAPTVPNPWLAVLVVGLAAAAHQGWSANLYTFASDTMPKSAVGTLVGFGGFASGIASIFVAFAVGRLLQTHVGYVPVFAWASTMYLISLAVLHKLVPDIDAGRLAEAA